ncbi:MAG: DUF3782 domain-containing protein [Candidatus Competibacteraceae bacterium]
MPTDITLEDIWKLFRETNQMFQETSQKFRETDQMFRETSQKFRETDEKFQNTDQKFRDTDLKLDRLEAMVARTSRNVDDLTGKWGKFLEGMVAPACKTLFADRNIPVHKVLQRVQVEYGDRHMEIDILVVNEGYVVLVGVKSTLKVDDVRDHLERLGQFREFFPEYADKQILGAVAGIVIEEQADRFAYREGLFVIGQAGDTVRILNDNKFQPKTW